MSESTPVTAHYGQSDIVAKILAALPPERTGALKPADLFPFDQLHGRELLATKEHAARLAPLADDRILDIGSGIGGPARYIAETFGSDVTGVDLTPQFVAAATALTEMTGLSGRVRFDESNATQLPYPADAFDAAICFYVGMNLSDKPAVFAEVFRVLKPGGRLLWTEALETGAVPLKFPLPWATSPAASHTSTRDFVETAMSDAGFEIVAATDETAAHVELARAARQAGVQPPPGVRVANETVLGPDFVEHRRNYIGNLMSGALVSLIFELRKPG